MNSYLLLQNAVFSLLIFGLIHSVDDYTFESLQRLFG